MGIVHYVTLYLLYYLYLPLILSLFTTSGTAIIYRLYYPYLRSILPLFNTYITLIYFFWDLFINYFLVPLLIIF